MNKEILCQKRYSFIETERRSGATAARVGSPKAGVTALKSRRLVRLAEGNVSGPGDRGTRSYKYPISLVILHNSMARTNQTRKRSGGPIYRNGPVKRSRPMRRRRFRRKSSAITSKSGTGGSIRFKARKLSRSRWNKMLWDSTLMKNHWRSMGSVAVTQTSPADSALATWAALQAVETGTGSNFWLTSGGAQPSDTGVAVPPFTGDLVIRGGRIGISFYNQSTDVSGVEVMCMLIKTTEVLGTTAPITGSFSIGWDPTSVADFTRQFGKVVYRRRFLLENDTASEVEYRLPIQKVDQGTWAVNGLKYIWYIGISNMQNAVAVGCSIRRYFNLSFVGDSV